MTLTSKEIIEITEQFSAKNYFPLPVVIERAEGVWVWDPEGNKYLDMLSCYSALNFGHCHPEILKSAIEQMKKVTLTSRAFYNTEMGAFLEELCKFCGLPLALPMNTGAEGVETALKVARKWGYINKGIPLNKAEIIVCENNFHGRTISIISFSTESLYNKYFGPLTPGFKIIPYGEAKALKNAINENTAAFLVEPIQGEGGIIIPHNGYLKECEKICRENNILLMLDEIQTGLGRTGRRFCYEYEGIKPDVLILGKALGGGIYPISAVISQKDVLSLFIPGEHGSTFGGNPLSCAIGRVALKIIEKEHLSERAFEMGQFLMEGLKRIKSPQIKDLRGRGLLIGIELYKEAGGARKVCEALMKKGILCKETHENVVRFAPPLIIEKKEIEWALERIEDVFTSVL